MAVFYNENKQYDLSIDGTKFSQVYNISMNGGQPTDGQVGGVAASHPLNRLGGGNQATQPTNHQTQGNVYQDNVTVGYENPQNIFSTGASDFKFDGFGKDAWGLNSGGYQGSTQPTQQQPQQFDGVKSDPFANPFEQKDKVFENLGSDIRFDTNDNSQRGSMWTKDIPAQGQVVEDNKVKKGFLYIFGGGNKSKAKGTDDDFDKQYDDYLKKKEKDVEIKAVGRTGQIEAPVTFVKDGGNQDTANPFDTKIENGIVTAFKGAKEQT